MKTQMILPLILISWLISSCGLIENDSAKNITEETPSADAIVNTEQAPLNETVATPDDLFKAEENIEAIKTDAPTNITATSEIPLVIEEPVVEKPIITEEKIIVQEEVSENQTSKYKIQKGETLMQVAFKLYGDISKWKDLKAMNPGLTSLNSLHTNTEINYQVPKNKFIWRAEGTPYLIKKGETLGIISKNVYQTPTLWKNIWENNKPLIINPNIIYAGFTLYYQPRENVAERTLQDSDMELTSIDQEINQIQSATETNKLAE